MRKLFHSKIHRHQVLGISLLICGSVTLSLMCVASEDSIIYKDYFIKYILISSFQEFLSASLNNLEKYLMDIQYIDPLLLQGLEGLFGMVVLILIYIPLSFIPCPKSNEYGICPEKADYIVNPLKEVQILFENNINIICSFVIIVILTLFNLLRVTVLFYFTPNHKVMVNTMRPFLFCLLGIFQIKLFANKNEPWINVVSMISYVICIIGMVIFLELVLIGVCSFDKNTTKLIALRSNQDFMDNAIKLLFKQEKNEIEDNNDEDE